VELGNEYDQWWLEKYKADRNFSEVIAGFWDKNGQYIILMSIKVDKAGVCSLLREDCSSI
jgi:hypothetical protein